MSSQPPPAPVKTDDYCKRGAGQEVKTANGHKRPTIMSPNEECIAFPSRSPAAAQASSTDEENCGEAALLQEQRPLQQMLSESQSTRAIKKKFHKATDDGGDEDVGDSEFHSDDLSESSGSRQRRNKLECDEVVVMVAEPSAQPVPVEQLNEGSLGNYTSRQRRRRGRLQRGDGDSYNYPHYYYYFITLTTSVGKTSHMAAVLA